MSARKAKAPAKRRQEKPVDAEIRRAARRAGIRPKVALEDLKTALSQIASEKEAKRVADELKAATVAGAAPDGDAQATIPRTPSMFRAGCGAENFRQAISRLLTGGLYVSRPQRDERADDFVTSGPHAALLHLCEVQTRILATALAHRDSPIDGCGFESQDWAIDCDQITRADLVTSLNALSAFAREGRDLLDRLLCYEDFRYCDERKHPGRSFHRAGEESDKAGGES